MTAAYNRTVRNILKKTLKEERVWTLTKMENSYLIPFTFEHIECMLFYIVYVTIAIYECNEPTRPAFGVRVHFSDKPIVRSWMPIHPNDIVLINLPKSGLLLALWQRPCPSPQNNHSIDSTALIRAAIIQVVTVNWSSYSAAGIFHNGSFTTHRYDTYMILQCAVIVIGGWGWSMSCHHRTAGPISRWWHRRWNRSRYWWNNNNLTTYYTTPDRLLF